MAKPPIAVKNLQGLTELMLLEQLAFKKCNAYARSMKDPEMKQMCAAHAANHKARFDALYDYLDMHE